MENTLNSTETIPTFQMRSCRRKRKEMEKEEKVVCDDEKIEESSSSSISSISSEEEEEEEEVERKIVALKRMVPGGERLGVDKLFEETAEYILALQSQIKALRVLANFIHGYNNNKEMTKFGA